MTDHREAKDAASTLLIKNVRLPPEAYASLHHVNLPQDQQEEIPVVDVEYVHLEPSSSTPAGTHAVEVYLRSSEALSRKPVTSDGAAPFQSVAQTIPLPASSGPSTSDPNQLVARFNTVTPIPSTSTCIDANSSISIPGGLCHPHVHLDKCYLLDRCTLSTGTFSEALTSTSSAKSHFTHDDVRARMRRLVLSSLSHGVTCMRAFVEVDPTVGLMCLEAGIEVKKEFEDKCEVQIVVFAQDAIFYPDDEAKEKEMQRLLEEAATRPEVDVIGSAPYVESLSKRDQEQLDERGQNIKQKQQQSRNITHIFELASKYSKHVDFHLDYDLDPPGSEIDGTQSMIPFVVSLSQQRIWNHSNGNKRSVTVGHCTKLSCFDEHHLDQLASCFSSSPTADVPPISFVALPPSDLYMQGRSQPYASRSRATLPLLTLSSHPTLQHHTNWAMGVNNVANLFTPQGDADPLALLPTMVGVWQSAKPRDCEVLVGSVNVGVSYIFRLTDSAGHELVTQGLEETFPLFFWDAAPQLGLDGTGRDGVDADVLGRKFESETSGQTVHTRRYACHDGPTWHGLFRHHTGGQHHTPSALEMSLGGSDFDGKRRADEPDRGGIDDVLVGPLFERFRVDGIAGRVDQMIELADLAEELDQARFRFGSLEVDGKARDARRIDIVLLSGIGKFGDRSFDAIGGGGTDYDVGSFFDQGGSGGKAKPRSASDDDHLLAFKHRSCLGGCHVG
ncbi:zinc metallopeptidase [Pseudozyma hubeiensis SY62]|uniref:Zinc metallopeptidase n=1 Tax=Pseudozyma hubeiensis (strain SY62) TaxID=1305764 RepID=R9P7M7_PSEHS|nr:zinc metallopeptidase [Pseudozyma hubeiensis SY62]GAC97393.1 zinc metallopeptidase [Pseudozyma hubeiensis SY62]